jgi:hypothetical protein
VGEKSANLPINFQIHRVLGSPKKIETCFQDGSAMIPRNVPKLGSKSNRETGAFEFLDTCFKLL